MPNDELKFNEVHVRGGFSDRHGLDKINTTMQIDDFDDRTRVTILNDLTLFLSLYYPKDDDDNYGKRMNLYLNILRDVYGEIIEPELYEKVLHFNHADLYETSVSLFINKVESYIENTILNGRWDAILTLLEYIVDKISLSNKDLSNFFATHINEIFEKECVGYRYIDGQFVQITDNIEVNEIEETLESNDISSGCKSHVSKSLSLLSNRDKPDYKNSIKESISAVESICKVITGNDKATLSDSLKQLEKKGTKIHESLKKGFLKLYGYTSDEGGIRHGEGLVESDVSFEDAKYMLVSCCAFVNYLIAKHGKAEEPKNEG